MKTRIFAVLLAVLLFGFTLYVVLDTFVIPRGFQPVTVAERRTSAEEPPEEETEEPSEEAIETDSEEETETLEETTEEPTEEPTETEEPTVITENSYSDKNIKITIETTRLHDTTVYTADVWIRSPEYLKTAMAHDTYGRNIVNYTSGMAAEKNAIFAVNGDYYGARERGYVAREGVLYRKAASYTAGQEDLVIFEDGEMSVFKEQEIKADTLMEMGAWDIFSFGPALVTAGEIDVGRWEEVAIANAKNQRTAIGFYDANHYVFVVSDGRTAESHGLSLYELAEYMQSLGVEMAYNLDGGGSSTMVFNNRIINVPTGNGQRVYERQVSDIVYIGY